MEWAALGLNFIENIVGHLAWSVVIVIFIFTFRHQVQNIINRLVNIKTIAGEANFQPAGEVEDLSLTTKDIQETELPPVSIKPLGGNYDRDD